ncbi:MAG: hypothetical protein HC897_00580 [Thermoanaerobaculia bacterium]|nr:hypothetical protein [Thermoanaerobaculia bacterium]
MGYLETAKASLEAIRTRPVQGTSEPMSQAESPEGTARLMEGRDPQRVAAMTLDEFASAGLKLRVHSQVLGCDVLFVSDNVPDDEIDAHGPPVYRAHELRKLALIKPQPHSLRCIHEVKTVFGGTVEDVTDREASR